MDSVFRDIRRKDRVLSCDAAWKLLERGEYGFLAMQGMNGYGYGIPLSYAMRDRSLYFHCAPSGFKLDSLDVCLFLRRWPDRSDAGSVHHRL